MAVDVSAMGKAGLTGWRGKVAPRVARALSQRVGLSRSAIEAIIGWAFLGLAVLQFVKLVRTAIRAGHEASAQAA
jgi:hypothetical protein